MAAASRRRQCSGAASERGQHKSSSVYQKKGVEAIRVHAVHTMDAYEDKKEIYANDGEYRPLGF